MTSEVSKRLTPLVSSPLSKCASWQRCRQ